MEKGEPYFTKAETTTRYVNTTASGLLLKMPLFSQDLTRGFVDPVGRRVADPLAYSCFSFSGRK